MVGGPGHLENTLSQIKNLLVGWFIFSGLLLVGGGWAAAQYLPYDPIFSFSILGVIWIITSWVVGGYLAKRTAAPLKALSEAILHISPSPIPVKSPDLEKLSIGKELVSGLVRQVYEMQTGGVAELAASTPGGDMGLQKLPVAVVAIDQEGTITLANLKAQELSKKSQPIVGQNLYGVFDLLFQANETLDQWISNSRQKSVTAQKIWRGVRISNYGEETRYVDLAASFSRQTEKGNEVVITFFDETEVYADQDNSLSFISLAVHELRTPLTVLRGYIEAFEEEVDLKNPELQQFMRKMQASAENLSAFVSNILNVARIDQNQLSLHLNKEDWPKVLNSIVEDLRLRAEVHGKTITLTIGQNIPAVGIDRISIAEVITNLVDNAIKYSPPDKKLINITSEINKDGLIETAVQDYGVGIPESVMPHLFEKFSRNYRNRGSIGGTGLGLYLSKALVNAHGGNIWVRSHDNSGSIFTFTILPYEQVAAHQKSGDNGITRNSHGWIKNHSMSRR